jgi:hypothetical protein
LVLLVGIEAQAQSPTSGSDGAAAGGSAKKASEPSVPGPSCSAPAIPEQFMSTKQQNAFVDKARAYQQCLQDYVAKQQSMSAAYAKAGNEAADTWNAFARASAGIKPVASGN